MSAKIKYTDEPLGKLELLADFLPSPAELAFREDGVKVTLALSRKSVDFFKSEATKHHTQYQPMIRRLIDAYVDAQSPSPSSTMKAGQSSRMANASSPDTMGVIGRQNG
jgi:hypothetical protein